MKIYFIKISLRGISPMIWRRLRAPGNTSLAQLHHIIQIVNHWDDEYLHHQHQKKMLKHLEELTTYIENNRHIIPNYGERWRYNEAISSSFVESTVNEVVTKRMVKKQQMQWSSQGAHYLLQTRTAALNGDLPNYFERWYPGLKISQDDEMISEQLKKAA